MDAPPASVLVLTVLVPFGLGYYLSYLYRTMNAVIAPQLVAEIGLSAADLGFLTSVYFITFAAVQLPLGVALDRYGPRRVQAVLLVAAALGGGLFAVGESFAMLSLGRACIGLGVSGCFMAALKANAIWWPRHRLPLFNNITASFGGFFPSVALQRLTLSSLPTMRPSAASTSADSEATRNECRGPVSSTTPSRVLPVSLKRPRRFQPVPGRPPAYSTPMYVVSPCATTCKPICSPRSSSMTTPRNSP